jgi:Protein of unknown function (DUF2877)
MDSITTANVLAASTSILPLFRDPSWEGRIVAVFHRSILCTTADKRLWHMHGGPQLVSPFSLRVGDTFACAPDEIPLAHGMPVRKVGSSIDIAGQLHLRLDHMAYHQSPTYVAAGVDRGALELARQTLRARGRLGGFDRLPNVQTIVVAMQQALADGNSAQLLAAARRLIGLGPGLTPSGDDFLVGYLRGLWLRRQNQQLASPMLACLRAGLLLDLDDRTTRVGAEFIRYALRGAFAEILDQAALALLAPAHPQAVRSALDRLLAQGETSGTDTTLGLLTCLEALLLTPDRNPSKPWQDPLPILSVSAATRWEVHSDASLECGSQWRLSRLRDADALDTRPGVSPWRTAWCCHAGDPVKPSPAAGCRTPDARW